MSRLNAGITEAHYTIKRFLGVNESKDGDAGLRDGEAAVMRNFRITDGYALKKRPGSKNMIGLGSGYVAVEGEEEAILTEVNASSFTATAYPTCTADENGLLTLGGEAVTIDHADADIYDEYYFERNGVIYRLSRLAKAVDRDVPEGAVEINGGYINVITNGGSDFSAAWQYKPVFTVYPNVKMVNGRIELDGTGEALEWPDAGQGALAINKYARYGNDVWYITKTDNVGGMNRWRVEYRKITFAANITYTWYARPVTAEAHGGDITVKALWEGYVAGAKRFMAAGGGVLYEITPGDEWSKTVIGYISTANHVTMFGMNDKLYVLDGEEYYVWDGTTFKAVDGYIPVVVSATAPGGGGQQLEQINKLTLRRRQKFSADGTAVTFQLAETQITSVDSVTVEGLPHSFTYNAQNGTVTFTEAPLEGQNNVEVWYTASLAHTYSYTGVGGQRAYPLPVNAKDIDEITSVTVGGAAAPYSVDGDQIIFTTAPASGAAISISITAKNPRDELVTMRFSEFFNGGQDNRVFLYGNGSNEAFYSGIDSNAKGTAEYFPDLNEIAFGDSSPLMAMSRHYNRLLAFKIDSTYSVAYDAMYLADGTLTAGFNVAAVNKEIGCAAPGQAVLTENRVRTPDGQSIYMWQASNTSGNVTYDQRNAKRISGPVEETVGAFDLPNTLCFFDKIHHEYYAVCDGTAAVQNTENDAWYIYTGLPVTAFALYNDELYYGTPDGFIRHLSDDYTTDDAAAIAAYWESGSLSFNKDWVRKYTATMWLSMKPIAASITAGLLTDCGDALNGTVESEEALATIAKRLKLKAWRWAWYKLTLSHEDTGTAAVVETVTIGVKYAEDVKRK